MSWEKKIGLTQYVIFSFFFNMFLHFKLTHFYYWLPKLLNIYLADFTFIFPTSSTSFVKQNPNNLPISNPTEHFCTSWRWLIVKISPVMWRGPLSLLWTGVPLQMREKPPFRTWNQSVFIHSLLIDVLSFFKIKLKKIPLDQLGFYFLK